MYVTMYSLSHFHQNVHTVPSFPLNINFTYRLPKRFKDDCKTVDPSLKRVRTFLNKLYCGTLIQRITVQ